MILPPILELSLQGVFDSGVPNRERIILRPTEDVDLTQFGIMLGVRMDGGAVWPIRDQFFWFGNIRVAPPSWIVVVTRAGEFRTTNHPKTGHTIYWMFWGRNEVVFSDGKIVPVVFQIGSVLIGGHVTPPVPPPPPQTIPKTTR